MSNRNTKSLIFCVLLVGASGCSVVEFENRLPDAYVNCTKNFVGALEIHEVNKNGYQVQTSIMLSEANGDSGRRQMIIAHTSEEPKHKQTKPKVWEAYFFEINGLQYLLAKSPYINSKVYTPIRFTTFGKQITVEIPSTSEFGKSWPDNNAEAQGNLFRTSASSNDLARILGDKSLSDRLFRGSTTFVLDLENETLTGDGIQTAKLRFALSLPGQLPRSLLMMAFVAPCLISIAVVTFLVSRRQLKGPTTVNAKINLSLPSYLWTIAGAVVVWIGLMTVGVAAAGELDLQLYAVLLAMLTFSGGLLNAQIGFVERWFWNSKQTHHSKAAYRNDAILEQVPVGSVLRLSAIVAGTVLVVFSMFNASTLLVDAWAIATLLVSATAGGLFASWLTLRNETVVSLIYRAASLANAKRAAIPIVLAIAAVSPGVLCTCWLQEKATQLVDSGLAAKLDVSIPELSGVRPIVREPTLDDGFVPFFLGVPQVDVVDVRSDEQHFSLTAPTGWRMTAVYWLRLFTTLTTCFMLVLLVRLIIGILLRIAATDLSEPIVYRPVVQ